MTEVSATRLYLGNMPKGGKSAAFACPRLVVGLPACCRRRRPHPSPRGARRNVFGGASAGLPYPASPHRASESGAPVVIRR